MGNWIIESSSLFSKNKYAENSKEKIMIKITIYIHHLKKFWESRPADRVLCTVQTGSHHSSVSLYSSQFSS